MLVATRLAGARGLIDKGDQAELIALIGRMGPLPSVTDLSPADVLAAIQRDKKVIDGRLHFVLPQGIGDTVIVDDVTEKEIRLALGTIGVRGRD